jgi:hypothetical protein
VLEEYDYTFGRLLNRLDAVAEDSFHPVLDRSVYCVSQVAALDRQKTVAKSATYGRPTERTAHAAVSADERYAIIHIACFTQSRNQPHALGNIETDTPEVDDIATFAESRRAFQQDWFKSPPQQPISQGWPGDAGTRD